MTPRIAIVGIGGQGRECLDIVTAMRASGMSLEVLGFFDDAPSDENRKILSRNGHEVLGTFSDLLTYGDSSVVLGIGSGRARSQMDAQLLAAGRHSPVLIHPDATVGSHVDLAPGVVVFAGARLTTNIRLGRHVHVNQNATIAHDCLVGDYATVNPHAAVSGSCVVGAGALVGANATVLQGLNVGEWATVGASGCLVKNVAPGKTVKGVPAR